MKATSLVRALPQLCLQSAGRVIPVTETSRGHP